MSIASITSTITRLQKDLSDLASKVSQETKKEVALYSRINQIQRSITKSTSASSLASKLSEIERKQKEIAAISVTKANLAKKEAEKNSALLKARQELAKEEERERKRIAAAKERELKKEIDLEKQRQRDQLNFQKALNSELSATSMLSRRLEKVALLSQEAEIEYDLFISHASEDKEELVRPLAVALEGLGVKVWYDEFTLKVGDSLRRSIDGGLSNSRFGTVILSSSFFSKNWTQYELDGMTAKEMGGRKMILPIWHKVTKNEVMKFSPTLADKVALNSSIHSIEEIAQQLSDVVLD
ncbi:TIR domain-containing protein [Azotobacter beijerinckii]|uniref:TIR domain-containing protein n=1 Tax=Azotobacter beijerinckii TaxID=170623 RepID=UPI0029540913|nr:TIR domain-containing protein [Azotobacter beijerinckii]MDV7213583.1 TIR domain-containing protein [Azotobacter beijerinckii]